MEATESIGRIMDKWETQLIELHLTSEVVNNLCSITDKGPGWWRALHRLPTEIECTEEIKESRSQIHGRLRQQMRTSIDHTRETIEKTRAMAKWKYVLKSVLKDRVGRKHHDGLSDLESLQLTGDT